MILLADRNLTGPVSLSASPRSGFRSTGPQGFQSSHGVALLLVIFIVALASLIVTNLTYTASLETRSNLAVQRGLKAEYLLKSAVNLARILIAEDQTPNVDGPQDFWATFAQGKAIPRELLGLSDPALRIQLEIRPEDAKLPLRRLLDKKEWRPITVRLFQSLGFDTDEQEDHTGLLPNTVLNSEDLVAALIDYMDKDDDQSFNDPDDPNFSGTGIEAKLPKETFPNRQSIRRLGELSTIPGFTPLRVQRMMPFVRTRGKNQINVNFAPKQVLKSLDEQLDDSMVEQIISFRNGEEGPFGETGGSVKENLIDLIGEDMAERISWALNTYSQQFQVIAKVEYGDSMYFARASLTRSRDGDLPSIRSLELF